jgi:hypothetical protein
MHTQCCIVNFALGRLALPAALCLTGCRGNEQTRPANKACARGNRKISEHQMDHLASPSTVGAAKAGQVRRKVIEEPIEHLAVADRQQTPPPPFAA